MPSFDKNEVITMFSAGQYAELENSMRELLENEPECGFTWKVLGACLLLQNKDALYAFQMAIGFMPNDAEIMCGYASALMRIKRFDEAKIYYQRALDVQQDFVEARWNLSLLLLLMGNYSDGLQQYESRWDSAGFEKRQVFSKPLWVGDADLNGKTILIHAEQGFGDTIQFIRYVSKLSDLGTNVILGVQSGLKFLLRNIPGISGTYTNGALPHFDYHCPLMSLPLAFKTDLATIPANVPYIEAPRTRVRYWAEKLRSDTPRIGLVWSGRSVYRGDHKRSISLQTLLPILGANCRFFSLQKEVRDTDLPVLKESSITDMSEHLIDFTETAAIIANLDLVITVDTAVAHLAGAMGKPVWIMLPFVPDWRWMLDRDDSPWYPTARLFRQPALGDWGSVVTAVGDALVAKFGASANSPVDQGALMALLQAGRHAQLEAVCQELLAQRPDAGAVWKMLGASLHVQGKDALHAFRMAAKWSDGDAEAHNNLGLLLYQSGDYDEAIVHCRMAIERDGALASAYANLGRALYDSGHVDEAIRQYRIALEKKPDTVAVLSSLAFALYYRGDFDDAATLYHRVFSLAPHLADAKFNYAVLLLLRRNFAEGWPYHEYRWEYLQKAPPRYPQAVRWQGDADVSGKTMLLCAEQGFGDTLQFIRYADELVKRNARVILEVSPVLQPILRSMPSIGAMYGGGAVLPHFDYYCPLMSLPLACKTDLNNIPASVPYLSASADRAAYWFEKLKGDDLRVGLVWSGRLEYKSDQRRSMFLQTLAPLLDNVNCRFFSLQKDVRAVDLPTLRNLPALTDLSEHLTDFSETAAIIANLDLVITVDTAVAHLAGAMGKPVWIMLPFVPDWRWMLDRDDSPWYPTARLFRQPTLGDWGSVVAKVREALNRR